MKHWRRRLENIEEPKVADWHNEYTLACPKWLVSDPQGVKMRGLDPEYELQYARQCWDKSATERGLIATKEIFRCSQVGHDFFARVYRIDTKWRRAWRWLKFGTWQIKIKQRM